MTVRNLHENSSATAIEVKSLAVAHESDDFIVVEKPAGLLSVPGREGRLQDCVINRIKAHYPTGLVVHRLDMDTSGLMIIALKKRMQSALGKLFEQKQIKKTYLADVWGKPVTNKGCINLPLAGDTALAPRQIVCHTKGKESVTLFEMCAQNEALPRFTRLTLTPLTGRTHQLRVHLAAIGHPILGCDLYAHKDAFNAASRLHLHAYKLAFYHPFSGKPILVESNSIPFETPHQLSQQPVK